MNIPKIAPNLTNLTFDPKEHSCGLLGPMGCIVSKFNVEISENGRKCTHTSVGPVHTETKQDSSLKPTFRWTPPIKLKSLDFPERNEINKMRVLFHSQKASESIPGVNLYQFCCYEASFTGCYPKTHLLCFNFIALNMYLSNEINNTFN